MKGVQGVAWVSIEGGAPMGIRSKFDVIDGWHVIGVRITTLDTVTMSLPHLGDVKCENVVPVKVWIIKCGVNLVV